MKNTPPIDSLVCQAVTALIKQTALAIVMLSLIFILCAPPTTVTDVCAGDVPQPTTQIDNFHLIGWGDPIDD